MTSSVLAVALEPHVRHRGVRAAQTARHADLRGARADRGLVELDVASSASPASIVADRLVDLGGLGALGVADLDLDVLLLALRHEAGPDERHERERPHEQRERAETITSR